MIVKIQKPLSPPPEKGGQALVSTEDRKLYAVMPWDHCAELFGPDDMKIYVMAELDGTELRMGKRLKDQSW